MSGSQELTVENMEYWMRRAETAEARVAELTARVGELEALNEKMAKLALSAAKKLVYFSDVLDQFTDGQKARRLLGDLEKEARQALAGLSDEAKSGSPAPVGEAGLWGDEISGTMRRCPACGYAYNTPSRETCKNCDADFAELLDSEDAVREAERAVVEAAEEWKVTGKLGPLEFALIALAKLRKAGGEQS